MMIQIRYVVIPKLNQQFLVCNLEYLLDGDLSKVDHLNFLNKAYNSNCNRNASYGTIYHSELSVSRLFNLCEPERVSFEPTSTRPKLSRNQNSEIFIPFKNKRNLGNCTIPTLVSFSHL